MDPDPLPSSSQMIADVVIREVDVSSDVIIPSGKDVCISAHLSPSANEAFFCRESYGTTEFSISELNDRSDLQPPPDDNELSLSD